MHIANILHMYIADGRAQFSFFALASHTAHTHTYLTPILAHCKHHLNLTVCVCGTRCQRKRRVPSPPPRRCRHSTNKDKTLQYFLTHIFGMACAISYVYTHVKISSLRTHKHMPRRPLITKIYIYTLIHLLSIFNMCLYVRYEYINNLCNALAYLCILARVHCADEFHIADASSRRDQPQSINDISSGLIFTYTLYLRGFVCAIFFFFNNKTEFLFSGAKLIEKKWWLFVWYDE